MASGSVTIESAMQEEGTQQQDPGYYNIMLIGTTGQGKSTTADKLLIANPTQHHYEGGVPQREPILNEESRQLKMDDITMWLLHAKNEEPSDAQGKVVEQDNLQCAKTRVKCLVYFRNKESAEGPHKQINKARNSKMNIFSSTKDCEVLSNETSRVRVMDVPGFFDGTSLILEKQDPNNSLHSLQVNNLDIMRRIVRIQTTLNMKFHRILYFLPSRGPLERANAHLKLELEWMAHYFGKFIFQCMVLVATVPSYISEDEEYPEQKKFPDRVVMETKAIFQEALIGVFSPAPNETVPEPPLIFVSMVDSCEKILEKVKGAYKEDVSLNLKFDHSTCAHCGVKIGMVKGQKVTCHFKSNMIPYDESLCHPKLVAKYSRADKVWGEIKHVVLFKWVRHPWPVFVGEECANCKGSSDTCGCMRVGTEFQLKVKKQLETIVVDHTSKFNSLDGDEPFVLEGECDINSRAANESQADQEQSADEQQVERQESDPCEQGGIQGSVKQNDASDDHLHVGQGSSVVTVGGLEADVAHLDIHGHHVPRQPYAVESQNPYFDLKG